MNHHHVACCAYKAGATKHISSHHFSLLPSHLSFYLHPCRTAPTLYSMVEGLAHDPAAINPLVDESTRSDSEAESTTMTTSAFPTHGVSMMAKGEIPGWLTGNVLLQEN
jgi:hypothetical protein